MHTGLQWLRLAAVCAVAGCSGSGPRPDAPPRVALLTIDTWRLDHFSAAHTPALWALASEGERFSNAWTPIGLTSPSHATMFTGALPWEHGMEANNHHGYALPPSFRTVAEAHQERGWATAAFVSAYPAGPEGGLGQGFDTFDGPEEGERPGSVAVASAEAWLADHADEPAFLWVHLYEPHGPYEGDGPDDPSRYAQEVALADATLAPLLRTLRREGALIVVAGDHGEVLLEERCGRQHERSTHEAVLRVPLLRWRPESTPVVHTALVGLDAVPALLAGDPVASLPSRTAWVAESGICEAGCAPGCRPAGVRGRDRVVIDDGGRWVSRPGRGTTAVGTPKPEHKALLDGIPVVAPPTGDPDAASLEALGYRAP